MAEPASERTPQDDTAKPTCPRCGSPRWVSVSLDGGWTRHAQCVPCGAYHEPVIGPGWQSPNYRDPEAEHPDYREERS
jgi:transcription elongation factor Elf1